MREPTTVRPWFTHHVYHGTDMVLLSINIVLLLPYYHFILILFLRMHETIVTDVRGVCLSACPFVRLSVTRGHSVQPFPNQFGIMFYYLRACCEQVLLLAASVRLCVCLCVCPHKKPKTTSCVIVAEIFRSSPAISEFSQPQ